MSCQFLDDLSLASLVAPTSLEEFRSLYWERQPLIIHRKDPDYYRDLFTLGDFDDGVMRSPDYVKTANAATKKTALLRQGLRRGARLFSAAMREGGTLVLDQIINRTRNSACCAALWRQKQDTNFRPILSDAGERPRFRAHWDNHDVFILQVVGSKDWKIEKERRSYFRRKWKSMGDEGRELRGEVHSFRLEQGDLIYIPRGFVHAAECGAEPSLHITLGCHWHVLGGHHGRRRSCGRSAG